MSRLLRYLVLGAALAAIAAALRARRQVHDGAASTAAVPWTPVEVPRPGWVEPADANPDDYPVKAKMSSGIYHLPGGASYDRTTADRCYRSADAAEADGLRPAKR